MEFDHFSSQAFEHLIQALSAKVLGPGIVVFGSGPDGGREATFEGDVPFPSIVDRWSGYIVVQAKCKERLQHDVKDVEWLDQNLRKEFNKFLDKKRNLRKPEYYIIASNVSLSARHGTGGKAKINATFDSYKKRLGLKGYAVWSPTELRTFLDDSPEVRRAYTAWLTPSDVLSEMLVSLRRPDLKRLIPLALARDLRAERDVRLRDAGQETEKPIYLEDVFIDLPVGSSSEGETAEDDGAKASKLAAKAGANKSRDTRPPTGIVARLASRAADKLDPVAAEPQLKTPGESAARGPLPHRVVVLGGPGQGKSTIGQFLAQVMRARTLSTVPRSSLNPQVRDLIDPILQRAESEGIWLGGPVRFPFRLDLPSYADALKDALGKGAQLPLLQYLCSRFSRDTDVSITVDDLRTWLGACPSILILDGLDEVPPSGNRDAVIQAIEAVWDDICLVSGDALVVVTTRPQGYHQDLNPQYWTHCELAPLEVDHAMRFAGRLADVRLSDPERRESVLAELKRASEDASTKLLMSSPLQVTVLFGISLLKGNVPQDRWDLFDKYYTLLRDREAQKPGGIGTIIRNHKRQIDAIHYESGFLLHCRAEQSGGASPYLTEAQFRAIIERLLREDEYADDAVAGVADDLARIATQRLVLLAQRVTGRIGFDIRSLQEFMAASQLCVATMIPLTEKLRGIATSAHWRHVLRIIASRIFSAAELGHYRVDVVAICHSLDSGDLGDEARLTRAGARLALDFLDDGIASATPAFARQLSRRALSRLDLTETRQAGLAKHFSTNTEVVYREEITRCILQGPPGSAARARKLLYSLLKIDCDWAERQILYHWPKEQGEALRASFGSDPTTWTPSIRSRLLAAQWESGPNDAEAFARWAVRFPRYPNAANRKPLRSELSVLPRRCLENLFHNRPGREVKLDPTGFGRDLIAYLVPLADSGGFKLQDCSVPRNSDWRIFEIVDRFVRTPSRVELSSALEELGPFSDQLRDWLWQFPWVLQALLMDHSEGTDLYTLSKEAASGRFGDVGDWKAAERRWFRQGLRLDDFAAWQHGRYLNSEISKRGAAPVVFSRRSGREINRLNPSALLDIIRKIDSPEKKARLAEALCMSTTLIPGKTKEVVDLCCLVARQLNPERAADLLGGMALWLPNPWASPEFADLADAAARTYWRKELNLLIDNRRELADVVAAFNTNTKRRGLLSLIAMAEPMERDTPDDVEWVATQLHSSAAASHPNDEPAVISAVAQIRLALGRWDESEIESIIGALTDAPEYLYFIPFALMLGTKGAKGHPSRDFLLRRLLEKMLVRQAPVTDEIIDLIESELEGRPSSLVLPDERARLGLPAPPPGVD